jgi:hypothetical protein
MARLGKLYKTYKDRATKKGREFTLTEYEFGEIIAGDCVYCGNPATGIDRKNNSKGYSLDNSAACCHRCNSLKGNLYDYAEMLELGADIRECELGDLDEMEIFFKRVILCQSI